MERSSSFMCRQYRQVKTFQDSFEAFHYDNYFQKSCHDSFQDTFLEERSKKYSLFADMSVHQVLLDYCICKIVMFIYVDVFEEFPRFYAVVKIPNCTQTLGRLLPPPPGGHILKKFMFFVPSVSFQVSFNKFYPDYFHESFHDSFPRLLL